ncbi:MAG: glutamate--tRNA ligase [Candidatus Taylorbacteria bacterium]|nr:glutamate--tRNA ligase [Candidatus Taylorbacteria bacterium]
MNKVITRFAPSPTGFLHAGNYRTALFAYIYARQNGGKFILRIEDTDKERSKKEYEDNIIDSLKWLGLEYDAFYRQSDRTEIYKKYIQALIDSGKAYISKEAPIEAGDRSEVVRFKNPNKRVVFNDLIRGKIGFDTTELGDFVIAKSLNEPVFHLAVVIDDAESGITHIIRGEDHISNTPRHILLYEALGFPIPKYAHIPLLLSDDRSKLSKRKGALAITEYRERGYLPEAVINYLALLGWHPIDNREVLSMEEIVKDFTLERIQKSGAVFDEEKLAWFNREYLLKLNDDEFIERAKTFIPAWLLNDSKNREVLARILPLIRDKAHVFGDIPKFFESAGELSFIKEAMDYPEEMLLWKKNPDPAAALKNLIAAGELISNIPADEFNADNIKNAIWSYAEANGRGDVLWPLRVSLTGMEKSPDPFISSFILGREESLKRIEKARNLLK